MTTTKHLYTCRPDHKDFRDYPYTPSTAFKAEHYSEIVDLRPQCSPIYDQLDIGSCTANAWASAMSFMEAEQYLESFDPSRLALYYDERALEDTVESDAGAMIGTGAKVLHKIGVGAEILNPYHVQNFKNKPSDVYYIAAAANKILAYYRLKTVDDVIRCLIEGYPIVYGFKVYSSFESTYTQRSGIVKMPMRGESFLGGHANLFVGYNHPKQFFISQNSWGTAVGDKGFYYFPFQFLKEGFVMDMWTIRKVS